MKIMKYPPTKSEFGGGFDFYNLKIKADFII